MICNIKVYYCLGMETKALEYIYIYKQYLEKSLTDEYAYI